MPIKTAIIVFPFLSLLFTFPYMIFQYRKNGAIVLWRSIVIYAFIYYLLNVYFLVVLPLPSRHVVSNMTGPKYDLKLFHFISNWRSVPGFSFKDISTWKLLLKEHNFWEPFLNVIMTIPFGVFLRYYFRRTWYETILLSFSLSLFFELTQLSGLYGIYSRPYRLFQVDDLFLNTMGGLIGYIASPIFVFLFPTREEIENKNEEKKGKISLVRRGFAFIIDWGIIGVLGIIFSKKYYGTIYLSKMIKHPVWYFKKVLMRKDVYLMSIVLILIFFVIIPFITKGYTIGKGIVKIKIIDSRNKGNAKFWQYLIRSLSFYLFATAFYLIFYILIFKVGYDILSKDLLFIIIFISSILSSFIFYDIAYYMIADGKFTNDRLSKTELKTF